MSELTALLDAVSHIAQKAGEEILDVYRRTGDIAVQIKSDGSPLTLADTRANDLIIRELKMLTPAIPVLSEESSSVPYPIRARWDQYWLIDPLDGTREFLGRNDEFTVNIALVRGTEAVMGVVHAPAFGKTWTGITGEGAWKHSGSGARQPIRVRVMPVNAAEAAIRVVASRRHGSEALQGLLGRLAASFRQVELVNLGSSMKICILAEGGADLYPRLAPTSEWDTAAAHAVLVAAGGTICKQDFTSLSYNNKESLFNPSFMAIADTSYPWKELLG